MLFSQKKDDAPQTGNSADVFDTTTENFENDVIKASVETPVLVDFWAPWCGPCKQLGPVLESAVSATNGKVRMAKINIDENQELAQAMRVQSVPTVFVFFKGQPVTAFQGVRPASEIKALMEQLTKMSAGSKPDAINISDVLSVAAKNLTEGALGEAQGLYAQILAQDENNPQAYAGLIRTFIAAGDLEQADYMLEDASDTIKTHADLAAVRTALDMARNAPKKGEVEKLAEVVERSPEDYQSRFDYGMALFAAGRKASAIDQMLDIMRRDKTSEKKWEDDKARLQLLKFFEAMGPADPETVSGRRKLSSFLFS